jgi:ATP-dependent helicase HrpA
VPGIIREKCIALLKGLPKAQRKNFIPVNAFVSELLPHLGAGSIDFLDSFISAIYHLRKFRIDRQQLEAIELRPHLKIKVRVLDNSGKQLAIDSSLDKLKRAFSQEEGASIKLSDTQKSLVHP